MTLQQIERALDSGQLCARAYNGNLWSCRRNGRTHTWKTRPGDFRIPVKIGFRHYGNITQNSVVGYVGGNLTDEFVIMEVAHAS